MKQISSGRTGAPRRVTLPLKVTALTRLSGVPLLAVGRKPAKGASFYNHAFLSDDELEAEMQAVEEAERDAEANAEELEELEGHLLRHERSNPEADVP